MKGLLIIGAGGMAKCILDCVLAEGRFDRIGFLVDDAEGDFDGYPILGKIEEAPKFRVSYPYRCV